MMASRLVEQALCGREVMSTWIEIFRLRDGKAVEGWLET
jgi:predicted SnoaL-like aldol condensation-catalyzing enzyme